MAEFLDGQILLLPADEIRPNPAQPRRQFDPAALNELADSIRRHGILQPLSVRRTLAGWELIAGERRLRAAKLAGRDMVPCIELETDPETSALLALVENLQRQDLHYFEEAAAIAAYIQKTGISQETAAERLGRSPSALANKLRLLRLSEDCRRLLAKSGLTERHARALLRLEDEQERLAALRHIAAKALNVQQTEEYIAARLQQLQTTPPKQRRTFILKDVRLFLNSVNHGLHMMRQAGVDAAVRREETDDTILLTIRIPKGSPPRQERIVTGL